MNKTRVLIIDDDARLVQLMREYLIKNGFEVNAVSAFKDTRFLKEAAPPHIVVLDVMLPGINGFDVLKTIRKESQIPVIILTARADVSDRVVGLENGADDYLLKPFEPRELVARIQTVLRRAPNQASAVSSDTEVREWRFKGLLVQSHRRRVLVDGEAVELTTAEFDLLKLFVNNPQQPLSRDLILGQMRGIEWEAVDRSVDILVSRLREKLRDDPRKPRFIRTVRSVGYQFTAEAESDAEAS